MPPGAITMCGFADCFRLRAKDSAMDRRSSSARSSTWPMPSRVGGCRREQGRRGAFQPQVRLAGGWLPGSAIVSNAASLERGTGLADRIRLPLYLRNAIQIGIAAGALGDALSTSRFYWALIAVIVIFMGANSTGEQVHKALYRIAGTFAGIVAGSLLATTAGHHPYWSIAVILAALFFQFYLQRINYAFTAFGVTVRVSLLVAQLGGFSNSVLVTRLEETALGAAVAMAVVLLVFPLHTRRVLHVALRQFVQAVGRLADHASDHLRNADNTPKATLRSDARAVDAAYQALMATAGPLRLLDGNVQGALRLASAARNYSRNLVADTGRAGLADARLRLDIELASATLRHSMDVITGALTGSREATYTWSAAIFDRAERRVEERASTDESAQLAIRDLKLIDGTMAGLAEAMGLAITDYDTVPAGPVSPAAARTRGREDTRADIELAGNARLSGVAGGHHGRRPPGARRPDHAAGHHEHDGGGGRHRRGRPLRDRRPHRRRVHRGHKRLPADRQHAAHRRMGAHRPARRRARARVGRRREPGSAWPAGVSRQAPATSPAG
jgi:hypothetical protein